MRVLSVLVNELAPYKRGQWEVVCLAYQKMQQESITFEAERKHPHPPQLLVPLSLTSQPTQL